MMPTKEHAPFKHARLPVGCPCRVDRVSGQRRVKAMRLDVGLVDNVQSQRRTQLMPAQTQALNNQGYAVCMCTLICGSILRFCAK